MATQIKFRITQAGLNAAIDADNNGLKLKLDKLAVGAASYTPSVNGVETALVEPWGEFPLAAGDVEVNSHTMRFTAVIQSATRRDAFEMGLMTDTGVLFAVASTESADPLAAVYGGVDYVGFFGLSISAVPTGSIEVVIDTNSAAALVIMANHVTHPNPHPQYVLDALYQAFKIQNSDEHTALSNGIATANTGRINGDEFLLSLIQGLGQSLANNYPKNIASGVLNISCGDDGVVWGGSMLSATPGWGFEGTDIKNTLSVDLTNVRYAITLTPEAAHEAYGSWRLTDGFHVGIWNRSGTRRVGYNGNISWVVVETMPSSPDEGNGSYLPGSYSFAIYPGSSKRIKLYGGGAGGGCSYNSTDTSATVAGNGAVTRFSVGATIITAGAGLKGTNGSWTDETTFTNGVGGAGGGTSYSGSSFSVVLATNGLNGNGSVSDRRGGASGRFGDYGRGGDGAGGVGTDGNGFGAGGGEGGFIEFVYTNSTSSIVYALIIVGAGGEAATVDDSDASGQAGNSGYAVVSNP